MAFRDLMHGTSAQAAERIQEEGFRIPSQSTQGVPRFGNGVYFFDGPKSQKWAEEHALNKFGHGIEIAVFVAEAADGNTCNLFNHDEFCMVHDVNEKLARLYGVQFVPVHYIIDFLVHSEDVEIVIGPTSSSDPLNRPAEFNTDSEEAWVVFLKSVNLIVDYRRVV